MMNPRITNENAVILTLLNPYRPHDCTNIVWGEFEGKNTFLYQSHLLKDCIEYCEREGLKYVFRPGIDNQVKCTGSKLI